MLLAELKRGERASMEGASGVNECRGGKWVAYRTRSLSATRTHEKEQG